MSSPIGCHRGAESSTLQAISEQQDRSCPCSHLWKLSAKIVVFLPYLQAIPSLFFLSRCRRFSCRQTFREPKSPISVKESENLQTSFSVKKYEYRKRLSFKDSPAVIFRLINNPKFSLTFDLCAYNQPKYQIQSARSARKRRGIS